MNKLTQSTLGTLILLGSWRNACAAELTSADQKQILFIVLAFGLGVLLTLLFYKRLSKRAATRNTVNPDTGLYEKMTHQARNHLSGILLVASNLLAREDSQDKASKLTSVRNVTLRTQLLLNNSLIYTQLHHNHPILKHDKVDLSLILAGLSDEMDEVRYQNKYPPSSLIISGDAFLLRTALHNLIDNAIKFSKNAPVPVITARQYDEHIEIQIIDHGKGIAPDLIEQIFEPKGFSEQSSNREELALGLFIAKQIIELHQGTLLLHSKKNTGTTVIITLPSN